MRAHAREKIKGIFMGPQDLLARFWRFMQRLGHERLMWGRRVGDQGLESAQGLP
ncbi:hypothetical protein NKI36_22490 [Mesorhizobium caraganae]|jgi:hypothetical protein|uniref:Uncharacterized protein n=1 Tax=Mesorhizobium caraganae TaxID=483206 RepID=A0ABV1Z4Q8_9HYPH